MNNEKEIQECAVCLQILHHPAQLTCGHVFCFLCVKGLALHGRKCAMCRAEISLDYLNHPILLSNEWSNIDECSQNIEYQWYYEGRNGWWKYDERSNIEIETAYNAGEQVHSLLLAGAVYNIDFQNMIQNRRSDPRRRRRIKRDTPSLPAKGIAGIKIIGNNDESKNNSPNTIEIIDLTNELTDNEENSSNPSNHNNESSNDEYNTISLNEIAEVVDSMSSISIQQNDGEV